MNFVGKLKEVVFNGEQLKRASNLGVTDFDAYRMARRDPFKYQMPNPVAFRPNMLRAREDAVSGKYKETFGLEPWLRPLIQTWCELSGLPEQDCSFWKEQGFREAVKAGRDIVIKQHVVVDGWAWFYVRDTPYNWDTRKRLPESMRNKLLAVPARWR